MFGLKGKSHNPQSTDCHPRASPRSYEFRDYSSLKSPAFCEFVPTECSKRLSPIDNVEDYTNGMFTVFQDALDQYAPISIRKTSVLKRKPYKYDAAVAEAKRLRRKYEDMFRKSGLEIHRQLYNSQRNRVRKLALKCQAKQVRRKIRECDNSKKLFRSFDELTKIQVDRFPSIYPDDKILAENFSEFFVEKVDKISREFLDLETDLRADHVTSTPPIFDEFVCLSSDEVMKLRKVKCSELDILPTEAFRSIWSDIVPYVTTLLNLSFTQATFPSKFKMSLIKPLLKNATMDSNMLKSYRPVSNLTFISKLIETAAKSQLMAHFSKHQLLHSNQSAYRPGHSVETALLDIYSTILSALDSGKSCFLILLDLSAAFDTISHVKLLNVMESSFGVSGNALKWIESYLSGRSFKVEARNACSTEKHCNIGVPQGSVLGPLLFNCVMAGLPPILESFDVQCHLYADDTQFLVTFDNEDESSARLKVMEAFNAVKRFMSNNFLKSNADKTVFIPFSRTIPDFLPLQLDSSVSVLPSYNSRNLGVIFDSKLSFKQHISELRQSSFFHLRRIKSVKTFIPRHMLETLVHAFITSRVDWCNSLFYGLPNTTISKIQTVHNACAKFLTGSKKYDSASDKLKDLHWLPVKYRIKFKLLIMTHKIVYPSEDSDVPAYLSSNISIKKNAGSRFTRSQLWPSLIPPNSKLKTVGDRSYRVGMPELWNKLPTTLRSIESLNSFKKQLKTYYFKLHYHC